MLFFFLHKELCQSLFSCLSLLLFKSINLISLKIFLKTVFYFEKPCQIEKEAPQK